tara:strand:- start:674 stop:865 length:192 start_codon:yes stop_codon:yes gene_type:complete
MKWDNRDKKLRRRQSQREMGKPFKRAAEKDSGVEKTFSKLKKRLKQAEQQAEMEDDANSEYDE